MAQMTKTDDVDTESWWMDIPVEYDPMLDPAERTFNIEFIKSEGLVDVFSEEKTSIKHLREHNYFNVSEIRVGDENRVWVGHPDTIEPQNTRELELYAMWGTMPIGCLTVKSSPRSNNYVSNVINNEEFDGSVFDTE